MRKHHITCSCGGLYRVEAYRLKAKFNPEIYKKDRGEPCKCNGIHFIHRKGSSAPLGKCIHYDEYELNQMLKGNREVKITKEIPF